MQCWSCGAELLEDSNFCHRCGVRVHGGPLPPPGPGQAEVPTTEDVPAEARAGEPPLEARLPEKEVWVGRSSIRSLAGRFSFAAVCFLATITAVAFLSNRRPGLHKFFWALGAAFFVGLGLWLLVSIAKTKLNLRYRLTNERLVVERGLLSKGSEEMDLLRVDDVTVHQGVFDRLANVGNIVITSTEPGDPRYIIVGVKQPFELKETVRQHARELRRRSLRLG